MPFNISNRHVSPHQVEGHSKAASAAKSAVNTIDKGARAFGTSLKRGMRQAIKSFNPSKLSAKVSPYDPASVGRAKDYAQQATGQAQEKLTGGSHGAKPMSPQEQARRHQEARQQSMAQWDRQHPTASWNSAPQRPPTPAAPARPAQQPKKIEYATPLPAHLRLERPTNEQLRLADLKVTYDTSDSDRHRIYRARGEIEAIGERNQARKREIAQMPWRPSKDTSIPRHDKETLRQRDRFEHVLSQPLHSGLSDREYDQLSQAQDQARVGLHELEERQAVRNAESAIMERRMDLSSEMDRIDRKLAKLDPNNENFELLGNSDWEAKTAMLQETRKQLQKKIDEL